MEIIDRLQKEWPVIQQAPISFILMAVAIALVVWAVVVWLHRNLVADLRGRVELRDDQLAQLRKANSFGEVSAAKPIDPLATGAGPAKSAVLRTVFQHEELRVWDLASKGTADIEGRTFVECVFYGPVMVAFSRCDLLHCLFANEVESILFPAAEGRMIVGIYGFRRCRFERCKFVDVGVLGTEDDLEHMRAALVSKLRPSVAPSV